MRHAAVYFAGLLNNAATQDEFDAIVCTDFLNLAEFKGLVASPLADVPAVVYFHENQFAYPSRRYDERDLHFGFTNFTSCLAADQVWFNSAFNRDSFLNGLEKACQQWPDYQPVKAVQGIPDKCRIEPPGISFPSNISESDRRDSVVHLLWASRWEHDKNPALLLASLRALKKRNISFRISVLGQSFRRVPSEFAEIHSEFGNHIVRWGFQESREAYCSALSEADLFFSTADHEFFGIAAAEAIIHGLIPLLPNRLAYPELIRVSADSQRAQWFTYDGTAEDFASKVNFLSKNKRSSAVSQAREKLQHDLQSELHWQKRAEEMDERLEIVSRL